MHELSLAAQDEKEKSIAKIEYEARKKQEEEPASPKAAVVGGVPDISVVKRDTPEAAVVPDTTVQADSTPAAEAAEAQFDVSGVVSEEQIRQLFAKYDIDGSGMLDRAEVKNIYSSFEHFGLDDSSAKVDEILNRYSRNADSKVTYDEFALLMLSLAQR